MCESVTVDGHTFTVCGMRRSRQRCKDCSNTATKLCDYPLSDGKTCSRPMCDHHAATVGEGLDYCLPHSLIGKTLRVKSGKHAGHTMKILDYGKEKYLGQCSCMHTGLLEQKHLQYLEMEPTR
jgi:hypothetical protein